VLTVTDPLTPPPVDVEVVGGEDEGDLTWSHPGTLGLAALVLGGVLTLLHDAGYTPEEAYAWLTTPDDTLPGTPLQALHENRATEVKRRAQALAF
jgi:hypothetical protein